MKLLTKFEFINRDTLEIYQSDLMLGENLAPIFWIYADDLCMVPEIFRVLLLVVASGR